MSESRWEGFYSFTEDPNVTIILEVGDTGGYDYSNVGLFKIAMEQDGGSNYYMGYTSGCSCTCPWEEIDNESDLTEVRSLQDVEEYMRVHRNSYGISTGDILDMLTKAREVFGGR